MPTTPLLDRIPLRREVDGNRVIFYSSAGLHPEIELQDEIRALREFIADEHDDAIELERAGKHKRSQAIRDKIAVLRSELESLEAA